MTSSIGSLAAAVSASLAGARGQSDKPGSLFGGVVSRLESQTGESTVTSPDGSSVTTIKEPSGRDRIVSETSASGQTLTEVGYSSPVLLQKFLDALEAALQADGSTGSAAAAATTGAGGPVDTSVSKLLGQLAPNAATDATTATLLHSFQSVMQDSGVDLHGQPGESANRATRAALLSFLSNAAPAAPAGSAGLAGTSRPGAG